MLRRDRQIRMQVHQLMDACLFAFGFWLAFDLRGSDYVISLFHLDSVKKMTFDSYVWLYVILLPATPLVLEAQGFYNRPFFSTRRAIYWPLLKASAFITLGLVLAMFLFRMPPLARWIVIWFGFISFGLVAIKEELLRMSANSRVAQAQYRRRFILIGTGEEVEHMRADLKASWHDEIEIAAELKLEGISVPALVEMLHYYSVNGVLLSSKRAFFDQIDSVIRACELEGVEVWLLTDLFPAGISRISFDELQGKPVMVFRTAPEVSWQIVFKQVLDVFGALIILLLFSPFWLLIALAIKLSSPGPVLFRQQRSGLNGKPFTLYKFRTMVTNAEQLKHELDAMNEMSGPVFKVTNDPRVTRIGRFLRRWSLDEFPQFYNVLRGEMSLVGPRPLPVDEVKKFNDLAHRRRLSVKPGLTCLWQISGRNNVKDFRDWVRLDLEYIDHWSFWLDVKILFLTFPAVVAGTGAK